MTGCRRPVYSAVHTPFHSSGKLDASPVQDTGQHFVSNAKTQALLKVVEQIPMFFDVGRENAARVVQSCEVRHLDPGAILCKIRESSDALYILLSGGLTVTTERGVDLAQIDPVAPVGEMGMLTGQPRSATVRARQRSIVLSLRKAAFESLMRKHLAIARQVHKNVLETLVDRLQQSRRNHDTQEKELVLLKRRLEEMRSEMNDPGAHS